MWKFTASRIAVDNITERTRLRKPYKAWKYTFDQYRKAKLIAASYTCQKSSQPRGNNEVPIHYLHSKPTTTKFYVNRNMCFQGFPRCKTFSCNCINKSQRLKFISMFPLIKHNETEQQVKTWGKWPASGYSLKCCCAGMGEESTEQSLRDEIRTTSFLSLVVFILTRLRSSMSTSTYLPQPPAFWIWEPCKLTLFSYWVGNSFSNFFLLLYESAPKWINKVMNCTYIFKEAAKLKIHFCLKFQKPLPVTSLHIRGPGAGSGEKCRQWTLWDSGKLQGSLEIKLSWKHVQVYMVYAHS